MTDQTASKRIINLAPTGMVPTRAMSPHVPLTVAEIVADVVACAELGATIFHLHARDDAGLPTYKQDIFAKLIEGIRNVCPNVTICVSLSGRHFTEYDQRSAPLNLTGDLKPDMASLTLSSLNFNKDASLNSPDMIYRLAAKMAECEIKPELEVFDVGMLNYAKYLMSKGVLTPPYYFNFILGGVATGQASPLQLGVLMAELPQESVWCGGGFGEHQVSMNALGMCFGGGVRTGLEDNLWSDSSRTQLTTNRALVARAVAMAHVLGRGITTPAQTRAMLDLKIK
jgi:3-keto-5-aminohexanoate cleavage enzyme